MNNEPVAWIKQGRLGFPVLEFDKPFRYESYSIQNPAIPLYTHQSEHDLGIAEAIGFDKGFAAAQAKTLTDEEIYQLAEYHGINDWLYETSVTDFARAILRKAQEK